jgi:hypothetical protein
MVLQMISSLVRSVAVSSMKMFVVPSVIFEWLPLITGGREQTTCFES